MEKVCKTGICVLLALCSCLILFACQGNTGLSELNTEWRTDTYSRGKEPVRSADMISYPDYASALAADKKSSPYYLSLNGTWDFAFTANHNSVPSNFMKSNFVYPDENTKGNTSSKTEILYWDTITVPSNWELSGYGKPSYSKAAYAWVPSVKPVTVPEIDNEIGLYRRVVDIPSDWSGREIYISFDGVASGCYVYVNGALAGYGEDSYTTKTFRITDYVKPGQSALVAVKVYKYTYSSWLEAQDSIKLGGIFGDVYLTSEPKTFVKDISVAVTFDEDYNNATLKIDADVATVSDSNSGYSAEVAVVGQDGQTYISNRKLGKDLKFTSNKQGATYYLSSAGERFTVTSPRKWSAEDPFLYTVVVTLKNSSGDVVDVASTRFGMVSSGFYVDGNGNQRFHVNGQPVKFKGVLYYEFSPETGLAVSREQKISDIKQMKRLNVNAVRSPGIPFSNDFLQLCEEYGLYVISDINLESEPYADKEELSLPASQSIWQSIAIDRLLNVVDRDCNRACIVMWAIGHQSGTGTTFRDMRNYLINNLDDRLIVYDGDKTYSDISVGVDWSFSKLTEEIGNVGKKPVLLEFSDIAYLNGAGDLSTYMDIIDSTDCLMGGFFGYWADKALFWPVDSDNASKILKQTPYAADPSAYQLTYSGDWGEKISDSTKGLTGILTADRKIQPEAGEYRSVFSPIKIKSEDLKNGKFTLINENSFINYEDNYTLSYEIFRNHTGISSGKVTGIVAAPGQSASFDVDYGTLDIENNEYFINFTVTSSKGGNETVCTVQFEITGHESMPDSNGADTDHGSDLTLRIVEKPQLYATALDMYLGRFYVTNNSDINFNRMFDCTYELYEINNFWSVPRSVLIANGTVNLNAPAHTQYSEQRFKYTTAQKAVENGTYFFVIRMTLKEDINEEFKAGYSLEWVFDQEALGAPIPFEIDKSRTPKAVLDADGNPVLDENGTPVIEGGDPELDASIPSAYQPDPDYTEYNPYTTISNDDVTVVIDNTTGLITKFTYKGQNVLYSNGPQFSTFRTPTGGDLSSEVSDKDNVSLLKAAAAANLSAPVSVRKISDNHYRVTVSYKRTDSDYANLAIAAHTTEYTVTYDIFGDGEIVVGFAYDPSLYDGIPMQVANILTLSRDFDKVSWYGRGPGESYADRAGDNVIGLYKDIKVYDMTEDYLYYSGNGDRTDVRWLEISSTSGLKLLISSDTSNFAFNASKVAPGTSAAYTRNVLREMGLTYISVIADQRGVSAGDIGDSQHYTEKTIIEPGKTCVFSYRLTPYTEGDADSIASTSLSVEPAKKVENRVSSGVYAIVSINNPDSFLSLSDDGLALIGGLGTEDQMWTQKTDSEIFQRDLFQLYNVGRDLYLTPVSTSASYRKYVEIGLGKYKGNSAWQSFFIDRDFKNLVGNTFSLSLQTVNEKLGSRTVLKAISGEASACWEFVPAKDTGYFFLRNKATGYYLTPVEALSYRNAKLEEMADKLRNYVTTDWNSLSALDAKRPSESARNWAKTYNSVTAWTLLPDDSQRWSFKKISGDEYVITNRDSGLALTLDGTELSYTESDGSDSQTWRIIESDGLYSFVNKSNGYALTEKLTLIPMTQDEINENRITDVSKAFWKVYSVTVSEWSGAASQKWSVKSESDLEVKIEAGETWFAEPAKE